MCKNLHFIFYIITRNKEDRFPGVGGGGKKTLYLSLKKYQRAVLRGERV